MTVTRWTAGGSLMQYWHFPLSGLLPPHYADPMEALAVEAAVSS